MLNSRCSASCVTGACDTLHQIWKSTRSGNEAVKFAYVNWILISPTMLLVSAEAELSGIPPLHGEKNAEVGRSKIQASCNKQIKCGRTRLNFMCVAVVAIGHALPQKSKNVSDISGLWLGKAKHDYLFRSKKHHWFCPFAWILLAPRCVLQPHVGMTSSSHTLLRCQVDLSPFCRLKNFAGQM